MDFFVFFHFMNFFHGFSRFLGFHSFHGFLDIIDFLDLPHSMCAEIQSVFVFCFRKPMESQGFDLQNQPVSNYKYNVTKTSGSRNPKGFECLDRIHRLNFYTKKIRQGSYWHQFSQRRTWRWGSFWRQWGNFGSCFFPSFWRGCAFWWRRKLDKRQLSRWEEEELLLPLCYTKDKRLLRLLEIMKAIYFELLISLFKVLHGVWKSQKKYHSTFNILSGQKLIKNAKNGPFWRVFEKMKLAVKKCYQTGQF